MDNIASLETNKLTWFVVGKSNGSSNRENFTRTNYDSDALKWGTYKNGGSFYTTVKTGGLKAVTYNFSTAFNLHSSKWNGNNLKGYLNGGHQGTNNSASGSGGSGHNYTMIGASSLSGTGDDHLDGRISEFIVYNKTLSNAERIIVDNYLAAKYGLTMAADNKFAFAGGYGDHVAGIGQDNNGGNNTDAKGTSMFQMKNPGDLQNGEYQLWGDDGNDTSWVQTGAYSSNGRRINRVWKNDETGGDPGEVTLVFHIGSNTFGDPTSYELLVDPSDTDFSDANSIGPGTYSSGSETVTFSGVNLDAGDHFTIGNPDGEIISVQNGPWDDPNTWNCGCVPTGPVDVIVNHQVSIDAAGANANKVTIQSGDELSISGSDSLKLSGDLDNDQGGTFNPGNGVLVLEGDNAQTIASSGFTVDQLVVDNANGVSFSNSPNISLTGTLTILDGDLDVNGCNEFRIVSSSDTETGRIGAIPSGSAVNGTVVMERHIAAGNGNAGYINMASPVENKTIDHLDEDMLMSGKSTGGFDDGCAYGSGCFYSVKKQDPNSTNGSVADVTQTSEPMDRMRGFELFIGDDVNTMSNPVDVDLAGSVPSGSVNKSFIGNWILAGNPFCSQISFDDISADNSGIANQYWVAAATGNYESYTVGGTPTSELNANGTLAPYQGFWVESNGASSLTIEQSHKTDLKSGFAKNDVELYTEDMFGLHMTSKLNSYSCRSKVRFHPNASRDKDAELDLTHRRAPIKEAPELLFLTEDGKEVRQQSVHAFDRELTIPVVAKAGEKGTYKVEVENVEEIGQYDCIRLVDRKTREEYDLRETEELHIDIEETFDYSPRFDLLLSNEGDCKSATSLEDEKEENSVVDVLQDADGAELRFRLDRKQEVRMTLYDMTGRPVTETRQVNAQRHTERFQAPNGAGIYMIVLETEEERITKRVKF